MFKTFIYLSACLLLQSCGNISENSMKISELRATAAKNEEKGRYEKSGDMYFQIWCKIQDSKALLRAGDMYFKAGKYEKSLAMYDDFMKFKGDSYDNYSLYMKKAQSYYEQANSVEKDMSHVKNALNNIKMYKAYNPDYDKVKIEELETYLKNILAYSILIDAHHCITHSTPSYIDAMKKSGDVLKIKGLSKEIAETAKEIFNHSKKQLGTSK